MTRLNTGVLKCTGYKTGTPASANPVTSTMPLPHTTILITTTGCHGGSKMAE